MDYASAADLYVSAKTRRQGTWPVHIYTISIRQAHIPGQPSRPPRSVAVVEVTDQGRGGQVRDYFSQGGPLDNRDMRALDAAIARYEREAAE